MNLKIPAGNSSDKEPEGYRPGAPLYSCSCGKCGNADFNAAADIGKKLLSRAVLTAQTLGCRVGMGARRSRGNLFTVECHSLTWTLGEAETALRERPDEMWEAKYRELKESLLRETLERIQKIS